MTATTALTAQNTTGVRGIHVIPAAFVEQQIEACIEDVGVDVIKTGLLDTTHLWKHQNPLLLLNIEDDQRTYQSFASNLFTY